MPMESIAQYIWFWALAIVFFAFKETDDRKLLIYLVLGSFVWSIHFWMLGLVAAAGINLFDVFKNLAWLKWKRNHYWMSFFIWSYILIWIFSYLYTKELYSLLPTISSVLWVLWVLYFHGIAMRIFLLWTLLIWFLYNYIGGSYAGMTSDIILIFATLYGMWKIRYYPHFSLRTYLSKIFLG